MGQVIFEKRLTKFLQKNKTSLFLGLFQEIQRDSEFQDNCENKTSKLNNFFDLKDRIP